MSQNSCKCGGREFQEVRYGVHIEAGKVVDWDSSAMACQHCGRQYAYKTDEFGVIHLQGDGVRLACTTPSVGWSFA